MRWLWCVAVAASSPMWSAPALAQQPGPEERLLRELVAVPGVSGREEAVRDAIVSRLPRWARNASRVDAMGNLIVTVGSGEPWVLYVAHMDEIGYMVTDIRDDGMIQVQKHGGFYDRQYEGRVVEIHTAHGPVNGVIVMPSTHLRRGLPEDNKPFNVESIIIDVGTESREETLALGVALLDPITVPKTVTKLAGTRLAARSMDDRFGCAALLALAQRIGPEAVHGKLSIVWSVQEEVGLRGAEALAAEMSPQMVVPIDSYVTSDSPLESKRIGNAPLGDGPIIRALDASNIAPIARVQALMAFAGRHQLPLRYGATMGGNDGSMFRNGSSYVLPLAIPIRYSHTAIETIDTKDLVGLVNLLEAMVEDMSWLN